MEDKVLGCVYEAEIDRLIDKFKPCWKSLDNFKGGAEQQASSSELESDKGCCGVDTSKKDDDSMYSFSYQVGGHSTFFSSRDVLYKPIKPTSLERFTLSIDSRDGKSMLIIFLAFTISNGYNSFELNYSFSFFHLVLY